LEDDVVGFMGMVFFDDWALGEMVIKEFTVAS